VKLSLSEISTLSASFAEDVAAYASAGFDAIGLWEFKLPDDETANRELLAGHGLGVAHCVPTVPSILPLDIPGFEGPPDPAVRVAAICASLRRLAVYEPESVLFLTGPALGRSAAEARAIALAAIGEIAAVARETGVRVGLEPVHPSQRASVSFVTSLAAACDLLADARWSDGGIMFDTYHAWDDPGAAAWVRANAARITGVHVCDHPPSGADGRALPGTSGRRTRELVDALRDGGWHGTFEVEIFSTPDGFWGLPVASAARQAHDAAAALLG
jgi:sugar phosphate isomerase/epimerase